MGERIPTLRIPRRSRQTENRPSACKRGYDARWQKVSKAFRSEHPCCMWAGCLKPAECVDHITPLAVRPGLKYEPSNLQSLCNHHHGLKSLGERNG